MIPHEFHSEAEAELDDAVRYYQRQSPEVKERFVSAVRAAIALVCDYPDLGTPVEFGLRQIRVRGFPYSLIYDLQGETVFIQVVAHARRRPDYWHGRE